MSRNTKVIDATADAVKNEQPYWKNMGLQYDPFSRGMNQLFKVSQWESHIELLLHLSKYSHMLTVIFGQRGIGKTTFVERFKDATLGQLKVSHLSSDSEWSVAELLQELLLQLSITDLTSSENLFQKIVEKLKTAKQTHLIIFDDAEMLSNEILIAINRWIQTITDENTKLHFVLLADSASQKRIDSIFYLKDAQNKSNIQTLELKPLSLEQTSDYLAHCLTNAGFNGDSAFTKREIKQIYHSTKGVFSGIEDYARLTLINNLIDNNGVMALLQRHRAKLMVTAVIFGVVALYLINYGNQKNQFGKVGQQIFLPNKSDFAQIEDFEGELLDEELDDFDLDDSPVITIAKENIKLPKEIQISKPKPIPQIQIIHAKAKVEAKKQAQIRTVATAKTTETLTPPIVNTKKDVIKKPILNLKEKEVKKLDKNIHKKDLTLKEEKTDNKTEKTSELENVSALYNKHLVPTQNVDKKIKKVKQAKKTNKKKTIQKITRKNIAKSKDIASLLKGERNIMKANSNYYTIQLIATQNEFNLNKYIKNKNMDKNFNYFRNDIKGESWYTLVYGTFKTKSEALNALRNLPQNLKLYKPWLRRFSDLHKKILANVDKNNNAT